MPATRTRRTKAALSIYRFVLSKGFVVSPEYPSGIQDKCRISAEYLGQAAILLTAICYVIKIDDWRNYMNTKMVCQKLSVTPKMLRIYEEQGLIAPKRKENNYREYTAENLVEIETIAILRHLGFSIMEIKDILEFDKTKNDQLDMFYLQYKAVDAQIRQLQQTKTELRRTINKFLESGDQESFSQIVLTDREKRYTKINYDDLASEWDFDAIASDFINRYLKEDIPYRNTITRMQEILHEMKGKTFIDVGCGTCNLWQECGADTKLTGLDMSLPMLLESRKKLSWAELELGDILDLDSEGFRQYDVVVSTFTLHHIDPADQYKAIDNMLKLCKEGGSVLIADRCYQNAAEKEAVRKRLQQEGDTEGLQLLESEYFIYADEVEGYLKLRGGVQVDAEFTDQNMVIYKVTK